MTWILALQIFVIVWMSVNAAAIFWGVMRELKEKKSSKVGTICLDSPPRRSWLMGEEESSRI